LVLRKAGTSSVTATDRSAGSITGKATLTVAAAKATHFHVTASTTTPVAGVPFTVTVTALDQFGNVAKSYRGTVHFTSTDAAAHLPADYPFSAADNGKHTFSVTMETSGTQTITVTDKANATIKGQVTVNVAPSASGLADRSHLIGHPLGQWTSDDYFALFTWLAREWAAWQDTGTDQWKALGPLSTLENEASSLGDDWIGNQLDSLATSIGFLDRRAPSRSQKGESRPI
jgi:hypothetical protein